MDTPLVPAAPTPAPRKQAGRYPRYLVVHYGPNRKTRRAPNRPKPDSSWWTVRNTPYRKVAK